MPISRSQLEPAAPEESADRITHAYQVLRQLIVQGRLAPGTRIIEAELATRLQVSRTPVRGALQRLQQEGYVQAAEGGRQSRLTVAPMTIEDARELFSIVARIEGLAARRAAELGSGARAELTQTLRRFNSRLLQVSEQPRPDPSLIFELDLYFHNSYVEAAAGPRLRALHTAIKPQAERYNRLYTIALVDEIHTSVDEHEAIIQGIADGDAQQAETATGANFLNAAERLSAVITRLGERGSW